MTEQTTVRAATILFLSIELSRLERLMFGSLIQDAREYYTAQLATVERALYLQMAVGKGV